MSDPTEPKLPKWPFYLGDCLLLGTAYFIGFRTSSPLGHWEMALAAACIGVGAVLCAAPFLLEYLARVKLAETQGLTTVVAQVKNLEAIAGQISGATGRWQEAQEQADRTATAAREIGERMAAEAKAFGEFMQRANDTEKATLRLEVDKLRRVEAEWLQVVVRLLDQVYALHQGAVRSGQANVIEQVGHFQHACRDAARRVGLTPFVADEAEPFNAERHQSIEDGAQPQPDATVGETIATGYTFQGKLIRPALVRLNPCPPAESAPVEAGSEPAIPDGAQSQLPLQPEPRE
jgi:molecular chaperone GrpE (heat shock protein)